MTTELEVESKVAKLAAPYYVRGLALGIPAYLIGVHLWTWVFMLSTLLGGETDFRHLYTAGYMVRSGHVQELYDYATEFRLQNELVGPGKIALPFNHPAYEALLFVPFSLLRYRAAYFAFLAVNVALAAISFRLLLRWMGNLREIFRWLPAAMFLGFLPVATAAMNGQDSILLMTFLVAAMVALDRGWELMAGLLVGLGLFKFQLVIPIALLFLAWRRWRFSAGFALSAIAVALVSLWVAGLSQTAVYARSLLSMSVRLSSPLDQFRYAIYPIGMPNLRGLISGLADTDLSAFWIQAITVVLSAIVLLLVAALAPRKQKGTDALLLAITTSAVVSYHLYMHDLSILLIPIAVTLNRFIVAEASGDWAGRFVTRASALMFVAPVCISYIPYHFYLVSLPLLLFLAAIALVSRNYRGYSALDLAGAGTMWSGPKNLGV